MQEENVQVTQRTVTTANPATPGEHPRKTYETKKAIFRTYQVIWYILGLIEVLLAFRFTLKALGANPASGFTNFIYTMSDIFAMPFQGIFPSAVVEGSYFEWSTLVAGIVYLIIAYGLIQIFQLVKPTNVQEVEENVNNQ